MKKIFYLAILAMLMFGFWVPSASAKDGFGPMVDVIVLSDAPTDTLAAEIQAGGGWLTSSMKM